MSLLAALCLLAQNDAAQANGRDNAWENAWVAQGRSLYTTTGKSVGKVIHVGDSITHANPYGQWARFGAGKTAADTALTTWIMAGNAFPGAADADDPNGFYLAAVNSGNRSFTASGGITTAEYLSGDGNGGTAMPSTADATTAKGYLENGAGYTNNLHITTVSSAFADAQFAVVMLGTNDFNAGRQVGAFIADLGSIVTALEGRDIVVIVSTIPPIQGQDVTGYNAAIRSLAQSRGLPLIDYYAEILARKSGTSWQGTLISGDGVHPTGAAPAADPYASGGDPATHRTGTNCENDGYLLRCWLTVQKLKEVKSFVADGVNPPGWTIRGRLPGGNREESGCSGSIQGTGAWALAVAGVLLALAFARGGAR